MLNRNTLALMSDEDLLALGRVEEVCERYRNLIYSRANRCTATGEDVEDAAGHLRAAFIGRLRRYRPVPRVGFKAWARTVVDRLAIDYQRYHRRRPATVALPEALEAPATADVDLSYFEELLTPEEIEAVERAVRQGQPLGGDLELPANEPAVTHERAATTSVAEEP